MLCTIKITKTSEVRSQNVRIDTRRFDSKTLAGAAFGIFRKNQAKNTPQNGGFQTEKLANTFFISNFASSTRGTVHPPAAQPDTRTGKPNTGAYKPNTDAYKPNTDAYKAINGESAESWYAASC